MRHLTAGGEASLRSERPPGPEARCQSRTPSNLHLPLAGPRVPSPPSHGIDPDPPAPPERTAPWERERVGGVRARPSRSGIGGRRSRSSRPRWEAR